MQLYIEVPHPVELKSISGFRIKEESGGVSTCEKCREKFPEAVDIPPIDMLAFLMRFIVHEVRTVEPTRPHEQPRVEQKIGKGYECALRVANLHDAFSGAQFGQLVGVEEADWKVIDKIIDEREWSNPTVAGQLAPFCRAWRAGASQNEEWKKKRDAALELARTAPVAEPSRATS